MITTTEAPVFVPKYHPDQGGTDFLGLRVVNVLLMDECLPGINNVTRYVRPFSLIAWMYWKFYQIASADKNENPTNRELSAWTEKIETLFTWGHVVSGIRGIPGTDAQPPGTGSVSLDFESWKRTPSSTSLMAAVQYGPPAKTTYGLSFIEPTESGLFRTTGKGVDLAESLDHCLRRVGKEKLIGKLESTKATEADAQALFTAWSILSPSTAEKKAFREAFFPEDHKDLDSRTLRRTSTIGLIVELLNSATAPLSVEDVRFQLFHGGAKYGKACSVPEQLKGAWHRWMCLQLRQAQRLSMEYLLLWIENRLAYDNHRDTGTMVARLLESWEKNVHILPMTASIQGVRQNLFSDIKDLSSLVRCSYKDQSFCIFDLMKEVLTGSDSDLRAIYALRTLLLCAEFAARLLEFEDAKPLLKIGGSERISLQYWHDHVEHSANLMPREFLSHLLEQYIISQHLSVAARRYDGGTQRLRISIEEEGLTPLVTEELPLRVTPDRLFHALSLMADCDIIKRDSQSETFGAGVYGIARAKAAAQKD